MAHYCVLVVGGNVVETLAPFRMHDEFPEYPRECLCTRGEHDAFDAAPHASCRLCRGSGSWRTTLNPIGRWDSFITTHGKLRLRPGRAPLRRRDDYDGLCWKPASYDLPARLASWAGEWDQARKGDVDFDGMVASGWSAYAVLVGGRWHQRDTAGWFPSLQRVSDRIVFCDASPRRLEALVRELGDDELLTLVDCHG